MTGRSPKPLPSVGYLRECFDYDPKSGVLMWRERPRDHFEAERVWRAWNTQVAEKMAGYINRVSGRWCVGLNNTYYPISRVALKWMTGEEPPKTVDHHDGDYANNKWENLRPATHREQVWNRGVQKNNTSSFRGVSRSGKRWAAQIKEDGASRRLGAYDTPEEAAAVYEAEVRWLHGEFYREPDYAMRLTALSPQRRSWALGASGFRGVKRNGKKWSSQMRDGGRDLYIGQFDTPELAYAARLEAKSRLSSQR